MPSRIALSPIHGTPATGSGAWASIPFSAAYIMDARALVASTKTGWHLKNSWDPHLFITWCDEARPLAGSEKNRIACQIQRAECERLFSWCAMKTKDF